MTVVLADCVLVGNPLDIAEAFVNQFSKMNHSCDLLQSPNSTAVLNSNSFFVLCNRLYPPPPM